MDGLTIVSEERDQISDFFKGTASGGRVYHHFFELQVFIKIAYILENYKVNKIILQKCHFYVAFFIF